MFGTKRSRHTVASLDASVCRGDFRSRLARRSVRFGDTAERDEAAVANAGSEAGAPDETDGGSQRALHGGEPGDPSAVLGGEALSEAVAPPSGEWSAREKGPPLGDSQALRSLAARRLPNDEERRRLLV